MILKEKKMPQNIDKIGMDFTNRPIAISEFIFDPEMYANGPKRPPIKNVTNLFPINFKKN